MRDLISYLKHIMLFLLNCISFGYTNTIIEGRRLKKQGQLMNKYGDNILLLIKEISNDLQKPIWLEFGTLLGAYREKGFIGHDYDMDLGMNIADYDDALETALKDKGFKKIHYFHQVRKGEQLLTEVTWAYEGFNVDFFLCLEDDERHVFAYGKKDEESFRQGKWEVLEYVQPLALPLEEVIVNSIRCYAPAQIETCLRKYYGEDFMTPKKGCSATDKTDRVKVWDINEVYAEISHMG